MVLATFKVVHQEKDYLEQQKPFRPLLHLGSSNIKGSSHVECTQSLRFPLKTEDYYDDEDNIDGA